MTYGRLTLGSKYKTSLFEASARIASGRVASVVGGAFRGVAAVGIGLVVFGEVRNFLEPETGGDWTDLFVGLGVEIAKTAVAAIIGAGLTAVLVGFSLLAGGPLWLIIAVGAGISMLVSVIIDVTTERMNVKEDLRSSVNSAQARNRAGEAIDWK